MTALRHAEGKGIGKRKLVGKIGGKNDTEGIETKLSTTFKLCIL